MVIGSLVLFLGTANCERTVPPYVPINTRQVEKYIGKNVSITGFVVWIDKKGLFLKAGNQYFFVNRTNKLFSKGVYDDVQKRLKNKRITVYGKLYKGNKIEGKFIGYKNQLFPIHR